MSVWEKQEANRKRLLEACKKEVGENLPLLITKAEKKSRPQVEAEYYKHLRWVNRSKKKYPGW